MREPATLQLFSKVCQLKVFLRPKLQVDDNLFLIRVLDLLVNDYLKDSFLPSKIVLDSLSC